MNHNNLQGLQGGTLNERYHLTKEQWETVIHGGGGGGGGGDTIDNISYSGGTPQAKSFYLNTYGVGPSALDSLNPSGPQNRILLGTQAQGYGIEFFDRANPTDSWSETGGIWPRTTLNVNGTNYSRGLELSFNVITVDGAIITGPGWVIPQGLAQTIHGSDDTSGTFLAVNNRNEISRAMDGGFSYQKSFNNTDSQYYSSMYIGNAGLQVYGVADHDSDGRYLSIKTNNYVSLNGIYMPSGGQTTISGQSDSNGYLLALNSRGEVTAAVDHGINYYRSSNGQGTYSNLNFQNTGVEIYGGPSDGFGRKMNINAPYWASINNIQMQSASSTMDYNADSSGYIIGLNQRGELHRAAGGTLQYLFHTFSYPQDSGSYTPNYDQQVNAKGFYSPSATYLSGNIEIAGAPYFSAPPDLRSGFYYERGQAVSDATPTPDYKLLVRQASSSVTANDGYVTTIAFGSGAYQVLRTAGDASLTLNGKLTVNSPIETPVGLQIGTSGAPNSFSLSPGGFNFLSGSGTTISANGGGSLVFSNDTFGSWSMVPFTGTNNAMQITGDVTKFTGDIHFLSSSKGIILHDSADGQDKRITIVNGEINIEVV